MFRIISIFCPVVVSLILLFYFNFDLKLTTRENGNDSTLIKFIKNYTLITTKHLTPEIKLRLLNEKYAKYINNTFYLDHPYWGRYYPGAQAIARYILDNPHIVRNKSVLEIGCGAGAPSIAAAMSGASEVTANDIDPVTLATCKLNAKLNNVNLKFNRQNLIGSNVTQEIILLSEVFDDFGSIAWSYEQHKKGKTVLLGDRDRQEWLREYQHYPKIISYKLRYNNMKNYLIVLDQCGVPFVDYHHGAVFTPALDSE